jgi:hypothetical protein
LNMPVRLDRPAARLKSLLARKESVVLLGAPNALFARVIEDQLAQERWLPGRVEERLASFEERQRAVAKGHYDNLEVLTPNNSEGSRR